MSLRTLDKKSFPAGAPIIREGEPGTAAYVVDTGKVEIWVDRNGSRHVLNEVGVGGIFGEIALIDSGPRSANASAVVDTTCIVVTEQMIREKIEKTDPMIRALLRVLVRNVRAKDAKLLPLD